MKVNIKNEKKFKPVILDQEGVKIEIEKVVSQIREAREYRGLKMVQVANDLGLSQSMISKDEAAGKNISLAKLVMYSSYYQVQFVI